MVTRTLVAVLFALGMLFGTGLAADAPAEPEQPPVEAPAEPAEPADPIDEPVDPTEPDPVEPGPGVPDPTEPGDPFEPEPEDEIVGAPDFFAALSANPELTAFAEGFQFAGLQDALTADQEWTVFAPSDSVVFDLAAFQTADVLTTYIVQGAYSYDELWSLAEEGGGTATLTTIDEREITVEIFDGVLLVAGVAQITQPDLEVANGFVHVIDAVLQLEPAGGGAGG